MANAYYKHWMESNYIVIVEGVKWFDLVEEVVDIQLAVGIDSQQNKDIDIPQDKVVEHRQVGIQLEELLLKEDNNFGQVQDNKSELEVDKHY